MGVSHERNTPVETHVERGKYLKAEANHHSSKIRVTVNSCRARRKQLEKVFRLVLKKMLKPRPDYGLDCLNCAEFARRRNLAIDQELAEMGHEVGRDPHHDQPMRRNLPNRCGIHWNLPNRCDIWVMQSDVRPIMISPCVGTCRTGANSSEPTKPVQYHSWHAPCLC